MILNKENCEHYNWGNNCSGWYLVKSQDLSIIEELMTPNTKEQRHFHSFSQQYFHILNGTALFIIEDRTHEVKKGSGVHILPNTKHLVCNDKSENLEFLVISQPTTRGDRMNEPFDENHSTNLNQRKFKSLNSTENGEVDANTLFHYRQHNDIIWATYEGGSILFGTLSGRIVGNKLSFRYQHQNIEGIFKSGKCDSTIEINDGKIHLIEEWEWTCDDNSKGQSELVEI